MLTAAPTVSVLIPAYNGATYIAETVQSVLAQSRADFELIISDDCSSDDTAGIVATLPDPRIRLLRSQTRLGFGANWNRCLEEARGAFVKIMPQDDLLDPHCLARQAGILEADTTERLALVCSARRVIGPAGQFLMQRGLGPKPRTLSRRAVLKKTYCLGTNPIGEPAGVMFRRSFATMAGPFDARQPFAIDVDYWLRLLEFGDAAYIPEALCCFRISPQSLSVQLAGRQAREFAHFLRYLAGNNPADIGRMDVISGELRVRANALARRILYAFALRRRGKA